MKENGIDLLKLYNVPNPNQEVAPGFRRLAVGGGAVLALAGLPLTALGCALGVVIVTRVEPSSGAGLVMAGIFGVLGLALLVYGVDVLLGTTIRPVRGAALLAGKLGVARAVAGFGFCTLMALGSVVSPFVLRDGSSGSPMTWLYVSLTSTLMFGAASVSLGRLLARRLRKARGSLLP